MTSLTGQCVVITGAASGIGRALAEQAAREGAKLLLADIQTQALEALASTLRSAGCECHTLHCDTGSEAAIAKLAQESLRVFAAQGGASVLINNAGVGLVNPVHNLNTADAHWLMNINFWGVVHGCQQFLPQLRAQPQAVIVNISSIFAMLSIPTQSIYNASKAAVRGFSDALRQELRGSPVRVLCVHPGGIKTNIARASRIGDISMLADDAPTLVAQFEAHALTTPEQAAQVIWRAVARRKTRVLIGPDAVFMDAVYRLFPSRASAWLSAVVRWGRARQAQQA
jgi:short-subunit dehydrogenase